MSKRNLTRRTLLGLMAMAGSASLAPHLAWADTQSDLDDAKAQYNKVQDQLDELGRQYQKLCEEQSDTMDKIGEVQTKIDQIQSDIEQTQKKLDEKKERLAKRARAAYKSGNTGLLSILTSASSFEDLESSVYYLDKISQADRDMIDDVKDTKVELEEQKNQEEKQKSNLEDMRDKQQAQIDAMQKKQQEVQELLDGLDTKVKKLVDQRDKELAAAAEEQKRQQEAAAKAASATKGSSGSSSGGSSGGSSNSGHSGNSGNSGNSGKVPSNESVTGSASRVISACYSTPSPGAGLCAMWVSQVFNRAGLGYPSGNANNMYYNWCTYSDRSQIRPGMIVAVSTHSHTTMGSIYGHIGIYIGNGMVMENVGRINTQSLDSWCSYYGTTVTPRWGWCMGKVLK